MKQKRFIYIIKKVITEWDGCSGCESDEYYTNWVFGSKERANAKCEYFNKEYGGKRSPGCRIDFEVEKQILG